MNKLSVTDRVYGSERTIHILGFAATAIGAVYLSWFIVWALDYDLWWFAIPLALANTQGYISILSYFFSTWYQSAAQPPAAAPRGSLDVFVATINESFEVLAPSVVAAVEIAYPHQTYVLDDGKRDWVRELCSRTGAVWVTRPNNRHAKAGNLNHALSVTTGEFIITLDADFVAAPSMAHELLGHFADPNVALVQSPQVFYNTDSFQHFNDGTDWNEQSLFHDIIMPAKNHWNAVYWCGSPAVVRRAAVEAVGGVATTSVTEDILTSVLLHRSGWRTLFDKRILARGIAPEDYHRFFRQRLRWTCGGLQLLRGQYWRPGFSAGQRLSYLASAGQAFSAARAFVLYLIPPLVLLGGQFPVRNNLFAVMIIVLMPTITLSANVAFGRRSYRLVRNELFGVVGLAAYLTAYPVLLGLPAGFGVTPKGRILNGSKFPRSLLVLCALLAFYLIALPVGVARTLGILGTQHRWAIGFTTCWAAFMAGVFIAGLIFALRHAGSAWRGLRGSWPATVAIAGLRFPATVTRLAVGRLECIVDGPSPQPDAAVEVQLTSPALLLHGQVNGESTGAVRLELIDPPLSLARYISESLFPDDKRRQSAHEKRPPAITAFHS